MWRGLRWAAIFGNSVAQWPKSNRSPSLAAPKVCPLAIGTPQLRCCMSARRNTEATLRFGSGFDRRRWCLHCHFFRKQEKCGSWTGTSRNSVPQSKATTISTSGQRSVHRQRSSGLGTPKIACHRLTGYTNATSSLVKSHVLS